jgi:heme A synthase
MWTLAGFWFTDARGGELAAWWSLIGVTILLILIVIGARVYVARGRHATNRRPDVPATEFVTVPLRDTPEDDQG